MVITEKQNIQTQVDRRHRRMIERMNRPRPEWNSQSQTLRSMDLFGPGRENIDIGGHPSIFHTLFQSVFDNLSPRPHSSHIGYTAYEDHLDQDTSISFSQTEREEKGKSQPDVHIIPISFMDKADKCENPVDIPSNVRSLSKPIIITDFEDIDNDSLKVIECCDNVSSKSITKGDDSHSAPAEVIDCDPDNSVGDFHVIGCDMASTQTHHINNRKINIDEGDDSDDVYATKAVECNNFYLGRKSLPKLYRSQRSKDHENNCDDILFVGSDTTGKANSSLRTRRPLRSNKDTLVGGANKVLEDMGPDGYYKGENIDIPPGAAYLSGQVATSNDKHSHSDEEKPVNEVPNYPIYSFLKKRLLKECRQIDHIKGDGNCFFRALSKQLYGSERFHIVLRNLIVDIIATNKNKFCPFVDGGDVQDHVERMSQEQSWATTCEIYAAATLLQRDIFMLTPDHLNETYSWLLFKPVFQMDTQHTNIESHPCYMTLCNTNGNHYDRIVPQHGGCNCFLPHPELDGVNYSVDLTS